MTAKLKFTAELIPATLDDLAVIQNMWLFYVYDMGRFCGFNKDWECPTDPGFVADDLTSYVIHSSQKAFIIKVNTELAGFVLLSKAGTMPTIDWNIDEFCILAKFQNKGIGTQIAHQIWENLPGIWEVAVIRENKSALSFWRNCIGQWTHQHYSEEPKIVGTVPCYILSFNSKYEESSSPAEYTIDFVNELSEEIEQQMSRGFIKYETSHGIDVNYKRLSLVLTKNKEILGVLNAYTAFAEIYIDDLWVDEHHRGKGLGKKLIQTLEDHFKGQGFNNINLVTSAFQAPEFYKKCGFTAEFTRKNIQHPQLSKTFFVKYFAEEPQTQGLL